MSTFTEAQRRAIAAEGNVLVSAGAGTGKTRTVVERCLRLIAGGVSLENILMVTFTEAAAAEMRARLRKELEKAHATEAIPGERSAEQLALLDTAQISTLHSFCLQLIREHFYELHIDPQVSVLDDAQAVPLMHETLDALLDRCYARQFDFADDVLAILRQDGSSDEPLRELVLKLHRYTQSLPPSTRWYERELASLEDDDPAHWREWLARGVVEWRNEWLPEVQLYAKCPQIEHCFDALGRISGNSTSAAIAEAMQCILAAEGEKFAKGFTKKEYRDPIKAFFDDAQFLLSLTAPRDGSDPLREDWEWFRRPTRALLRLAQQFTNDFARAKRAQGGVDFADLEQLALRLLVDERGEPTPIARTWQARFGYVFVDECQDINAAQDAIIRAVSRGEPSGNRFLVGDVKQSIYRFRLADPGIFRRYEETWRDGRGGERIPLADNFRSREGILNFINPLFRDLMRESIGGVQYDADARLRFGAPEKRAALSAASEPRPRVELHVIHKTHGEENGNGEANGEAAEGGEENGAGGGPTEDVLAIEKEARLVARRLRALHGQLIWDEDRHERRPAEWRDMVVLLRSPASRVETFAKEFSRAGVPLAAARAGFYAAIEVQDLVNLLRLLDNPLQDIPLAAVLRSPLVAMSADELAIVRLLGTNGDRQATFVAAVNRFRCQANAHDAPTATSARAKLERFFDDYARWRTLARQTSVAHCLETVLAETHYEALLLAQPRGRERVANLHRLLDLARHYDPFHRQGLYRFLRFIAEQEDAEIDQDSATVETTNAVRLMSIHKSKGLEFPIVVLACMGGQFNTQDLRGNVLLSAEYGLCGKITAPELGQRYPSLPWWLAKRRETRELLGEEMRLLYVAMTRARDTLVLTAFDKSRESGMRWHETNARLDDRALLKSQSYFAWLRAWLKTHTNATHWPDERTGAVDWLKWELHPENDPMFSTPTAATKTSPDESPQNIDLDALRKRITWEYPFRPATREPAKSNVSALRRRTAETDLEARVPFPPRRAQRREGGLAANDLGSAYHKFLQHVRLERVGSLIELRGEAERLVTDGHLSRAEANAIAFDSLLAFWSSAKGRRIREQAGQVHRELPFTARFSPGELRAVGISVADVPDDEFIIVQGVVDLAVVTCEEIHVLDFKTDQFARSELPEKIRTYTPQLQLYASALERLYGRPVSSLALHFLRLGVTVPIAPPSTHRSADILSARIEKT